MWRQPAQSLVEYGLLMTTVALVVLAGGAAFGGVLLAWLTAVLQAITAT
jgi:Flp pilus assembly pilin Flp